MINIRHVVTDGEFLEISFLVEVIDGLHGDVVRNGAIRSVEVPHFKLAVNRDISSFGIS